MDFVDYAQNRRIRELKDDLESAHASIAHQRRRLRSELSSLRGSLEQRLDRVSATLDAFVELSDIRATLAMFDAPAMARHRTLQMLDGSLPARLDLADTTDYWLVPAAHGLYALLSGDPGTARARFDQAAGRDEVRARHFAALTLTLTSAEHARALGKSLTADLLPHLPVPTAEVTRGQRALWMLTADGAFGDDAREHLLLSTLRHWSREGAAAPVSAALRTPGMRGVGERPTGRPRRSTAPDTPHELAGRLDAAAALAAMRDNVTRIASLDSGEEPAGALAPDTASAEFLESALRLLVEEGSPEEAPLLVRSRELRAVIESSGGAGPQPVWEDTVGTVAGLLDEDLGRDDAPAHRRTLALALQRASLLESVDSLLAEATEPAPRTSTVAVSGGRVTLTVDGAAPDDLARIERQIDDRHRPENSNRLLLWGGVAAAGLFVLLGVMTMSPVTWFLALVGLGCALVGNIRDGGERTAAATARDSARRRLRRDVDSAAGRWRTHLAAAEESAASARLHADRLRALLGR